jgi:putative FmdB family regulatory protein
MPFYEHQCTSCQYEWEEEYSINDNPPKTCPKCGEETVKRLISLGGKGVVVLTGRDMIEKCKVDAQQTLKEAHKNENTYANLLGENSFHQLQTNYDRNH